MTRARRSGFLAVLGALGLLAAAGAVLLAGSKHVEVAVEDRLLATRTLAGDVGEVLDRLAIEVTDADRVEPPPGTPVRDGMVIVVDRARTIEVRIDGQPSTHVETTAATVAEVLRAAGLEHLLTRDARIRPAPTSPVSDGGRIDVTLPTMVRVRVDGREHRFATYAVTVAGALDDLEVAIDERDRVDPPRERPLDPDLTITVQRVDVREESLEEPIEHAVERRATEELPAGQTRVAEPGEDGLRRTTYRITLVDGEVVDRELTSQEVVREPTDRLVLVGTGPAPPPAPEPPPAPTPVREAQRLLTDLGYPVGPIDGIEGPQTRRALCAWRRLEGRAASRASLVDAELTALRASEGLPAAAPGRGVTVDITCQVLYRRSSGRWQQVVPASTGADGLPRPGTYTISWKLPGWHTSSLYPAATPNMYNSMYFHGAIAIHGSHHVPPRPASAGCVRVTPAAADQLFALLEVGDPVLVIGGW